MRQNKMATLVALVVLCLLAAPVNAEVGLLGVFDAQPAQSNTETEYGANVANPVDVSVRDRFAMYRAEIEPERSGEAAAASRHIDISVEFNGSYASRHGFRLYEFVVAQDFRNETSDLNGASSWLDTMEQHFKGDSDLSANFFPITVHDTDGSEITFDHDGLQSTDPGESFAAWAACRLVTAARNDETLTEWAQTGARGCLVRHRETLRLVRRPNGDGFEVQEDVTSEETIVGAINPLRGRLYRAQGRGYWERRAAATERHMSTKSWADPGYNFGTYRGLGSDGKVHDFHIVGWVRPQVNASEGTVTLRLRYAIDNLFSYGTETLHGQAALDALRRLGVIEMGADGTIVPTQYNPTEAVVFTSGTTLRINPYYYRFVSIPERDTDPGETGIEQLNEMVRNGVLRWEPEA